MPGLGALFLAFVIVYALASGSLNGIEIAFGVGLSAFGLVLSFLSARIGKAPYYTAGRRRYGE